MTTEELQQKDKDAQKAAKALQKNLNTMSTNHGEAEDAFIIYQQEIPHRRRGTDKRSYALL